MLFTRAFRSITRSCLSLTALITLGLSATFAQAQQEATEDWVNATMCAANDRAVDLSKAPSFTYTGADGNNPRYLSAAQSGLVTGDFAILELACGESSSGGSKARGECPDVESELPYPGRICFCLVIDAWRMGLAVKLQRKPNGPGVPLGREDLGTPQKSSMV